jgi:hypothetical protein
VSNACERVEKAAKAIKKTVNKLQNGKPVNYAQAARTGNIRKS